MKKAHEILGVRIVGGLREASTPWAGASLLVELIRRSGVGGVANKVLPAKKSAKGLRQGQMVESFVLLSALGGECMDDMQHLRGAGLAATGVRDSPALAGWIAPRIFDGGAMAAREFHTARIHSAGGAGGGKAADKMGLCGCSVDRDHQGQRSVLLCRLQGHRRHRGILGRDRAGAGR